MEKLCRLFGNSRQAFYQDQKRIHQQGLDEELIIEMVRKKRVHLKKAGGRKLYELLSSEFNRLDLKLGRDAFFDILRWYGLLIRRRKRKVATTYSKHWMRKYPNLIKGYQVIRPNQIWVSDITYIETDEGFMYLFLITDAYSRKIIGYHLSSNLKSNGAIQALQMAIETSQYSFESLIHHSDRGIQYCSQEYIDLLQQYGIQVSMTAKGDPLENAIAERVNGILKDEWIYLTHYHTKVQALSHLEQIINDYNNLRPHLSLDMLTPQKAYQSSGPLRKRWKSYYKKKPPEFLTAAP